MSKKFFYRVLEGDSIISIAKKFNLPAQIIIKQNNLTSEVLVGDMLYIEICGGVVYSVKPFDTFSSIAKKFNTTKESLIEKNNLDYIFYGLDIFV
jgi:spore germination protein YaaH